MKLNQFAVYRVDQQTAGKALWHLPYQEARQQNVSITVENYRLISIHEMQENEKVADIWKRTKNQCEVSDVLVLNKNGEISCYYVDENYPQYLAGFIRINTSGALITMETENYQIDGKKGNWIATDTVIIDGKQFYLMEHQVYRDQAQGVILDAYGKMVVEECKKFDEKTKQKIHDYIQQQVPLNPVEQLKQDGKIRLEHYQKFYQNGTYERSRESGTEANYDMVDGLVNNQKKNLEKISDALMQVVEKDTGECRSGRETSDLWKVTPDQVIYISTEPVQPDITVIGEPVTMGSLAAAIEHKYEKKVQLLCPLEITEGILRKGDQAIQGEEAMEERLKTAKIIIADPLYRSICPETARFYDLPHIAFSGRIFLKKIKKCGIFGALSDIKLP